MEASGFSTRRRAAAKFPWAPRLWTHWPNTSSSNRPASPTRTTADAAEEYPGSLARKVAAKTPHEAKREVARLSDLINWARTRGYSDFPNPCAGVERTRERPRQVVVTDAQYRALWEVSPPELQDSLDLLLLTGQRPGDVRKMRRSDLVEGHLEVRQQKTGAPLRIEVAGELAEVIARCLGRSRRATGPYLAQTDAGQALSQAMVRDRFDAARAAVGATWQLRDLDAKATTDSDSPSARPGVARPPRCANDQAGLPAWREGAPAAVSAGAPETTATTTLTAPVIAEYLHHYQHDGHGSG